MQKYLGPYVGGTERSFDICYGSEKGGGGSFNFRRVQVEGSSKIGERTQVKVSRFKSISSHRKAMR